MSSSRWKRVLQDNDAGYLYKLDVSALNDEEKGALGSIPYAPVSTSDAYYVRLPWTAREIWCDQNKTPMLLSGESYIRPTTNFYVPMRWLRDLALDRLPEPYLP